MPTDDPFAPGARIGNYEVISQLGHGGMGGVYLARQIFLQKRFAIKVLNDELAALPEFAEVFRNEARMLAALRHPHIVQVHDFGVAPGERHYFVMDYVEGGTLETLRRERGGKLPPDETLALLRAIASALAHAHSLGIVHRDLKPENFLLDADGVVRVSDFGLARLCAAAADGPGREREGGDTFVRFARQARDTPELTGGTEGFMAPEVKAGGAGDARSDIYALGVVARLLLTGRASAADMKPLAQLVPGIDPRWDGVVARCLDPDPNRRFADGHALELALDDLAGVDAVRERAPMWLWILPAPMLAIVAAAVFMALNAGDKHARPAPEPAQPQAPAAAQSPVAMATPLPGNSRRQREHSLRAADATLGYGLRLDDSARSIAGWRTGSRAVWRRDIAPGTIRLSAVYRYTPELGAKPARLAVRLGSARLSVYLPASVSTDTPMLASLGEIEVTSPVDSVEVELVEGPARDAHLILGPLMLDSAPPKTAAP